MNNQARTVQYFLFSEYFSDGLRITLGVLLPSLVFGQFNNLEIGLTLSLGAVCASIVDAPGPVVHKRNGMLACTICIFLVALLTGFARLNSYALGLEIAALCFFFSMFSVFGVRAGGLGTAGLFVMVLMLDKALKPAEVLGYSALLPAGALWYMALSLSFFKVLPYRPAQQALGECIHEIAKFIRLKAEFYSAGTDLETDYQKVVAQQIVVHEKQDAVREILFKSKQISNAASTTSRILILTFVDLVDLFERTTAIHYDYATLRQHFGHTPVLTQIADTIRRTADVLDNIGFAIQSNLGYKNRIDLNAHLENLKDQINGLSENPGQGSSLPLKKVLINIRNLNVRINKILDYYNTKQDADKSFTKLEYSRFITHQDYSLKIFRDNLTFKSAYFKHALRVALAGLFGFVLTKYLSYGPHSYWVLLTIIFIMKPGFSLTKERNYQRIIGTLAGGLIGAIILLYIPDTRAQFFFLLLCMIGTYSFQRINYRVSVIFMTPIILLLFKFLGLGGINIVQERIVDTFIGSAIAFAASYLIFPNWESDQLPAYMQQVLKANNNYLRKLTDLLSGKVVSMPEYKLVRKEVYVSAANLSAAFQRMISEPKRKQKNQKEVQKFVVLNHMLTSYIATVAATNLAKEQPVKDRISLRPLKRAIITLNDTLKKINPAYQEFPVDNVLPEPGNPDKEPLTAEERLEQEQLHFIRKASKDIARITDAILLQHG